MAKKKQVTVSDELRAAIRASGTSYKLAKTTGVAEAVIGRFLRGERDLRLATVDRLAAALGLRLVGRPK